MSSVENVFFANALARASRFPNPRDALLSLHDDLKRYSEAATRAHGFPLARTLWGATAGIATVEETDYAVFNRGPDRRQASRQANRFFRKTENREG